MSESVKSNVVRLDDYRQPVISPMGIFWALALIPVCAMLAAYLLISADRCEHDEA